MPNVGQTQPAGSPPGARQVNPAALLPGVTLSSQPPPPMPSGATPGVPPPTPSNALGNLPCPVPSGAPSAVQGAVPPPMPSDPDAPSTRPNEGGRRSTLQLAPRLSRGVG